MKTYTNKRQKFTATTLTNNKVNQKQSLVYANENLSSINFRIYNLESNGIINSFTKTISIDNSVSCSDMCPRVVTEDPTICYELVELEPDVFTSVEVPCTNFSTHCPQTPLLKDSNEYLEGDFNGDGLSEVIVLSHYQTRSYNLVESNVNRSSSSIGIGDTSPLPTSSACLPTDTTHDLIYYAQMIDLNPNSSTDLNTSGNFALSNSNAYLLSAEKRYVMDFNSDGKADVLIINKNKTYKVLSFKQLSSAPWTEIEVIGEGTLDSYSTTKPLLLGDFNGDGKPDIMLPVSEGKCYPSPAIYIPKTNTTIPAVVCPDSNLWNIYYSNPNPNGGNYFAKESFKAADYLTWDSFNSYPMPNYTYYAMDVNKDGKSDLVRIFTNLFQYNSFFDPKDIDSSWKVSTYINNIGLNGGFTNNYTSPTPHNNNDNSRPIPIISNYKYRGLDSDLLMIRYHGGNSFAKTVTFIDFTKDISEDNLLQKVTQSNGAIIDEINYSTMVSYGGSNGLGSSDEFYSSSEGLEYPLIELKRLDSNKLVAELKNTSLGVIKKQDFKYYGLAVNLNGIGVIGFKKTARSSWYRTYFDKKNWSVTENNSVKRGAVEKISSLILNGTEKFNFGTNYTNLISKTENTFTETINPISRGYALLLNSQTTTDYLTNIVNQKVYNNYSSDYLLPTSVTNNNLLGTVLHGSDTVITTYDNNPTGVGNTYYIGRPNEVNTSKTVYVNTPVGIPNTKTFNEKYFYTNSNVTRTEKKSNSSNETLVETFNYFSNGLLQSKTISATGTTVTNAVSNRSSSYTYDTSNRFIKTTTDSEGLITTNLTFHPLYGTVLTQQNPFSQITSSIYDNWGKRTKVTDFLGKSINYTYSRTVDIYKTLQVGDDGSRSMIESDVLARQIRKGAIDLNGNWVYASSEYDFLGRKLKDSEPYLSTASPSLWTLYEYDDYNRPIKTTSPTGKIINTTYNGLLVSAADSVMTKSKTMNANGQVISATDSPGGTISYKYDADKNLTESDYEGVKVTIQYDNWGRKTQLEDSSAGIYTTTYNAFGETLTETTPKGSTTYTLSPVGKLLTKAISGDGTSITSTNTYDPINKRVTNIAVVNRNDGNSNYAYSYDPITKQLNKTIEILYPVGSSTAFATFTKEFVFDTFGRVSKEISTAVSHGKTSSKTITSVFKNGVEWQLLDGTIVKWQANAINARGQLTSATLGNGISITNTYDDFGFNTQNKHLSGTTNVMTLNNEFEPILGNLKNRYNSMFGWTENFKYDTSDRLTEYTNNSGIQISQNYDNRGRITENVIGQYNYTNTNKPYQNTSVITSAQANTYYATRPIQNISYNAFKAPIQIEEQGIDKISFGYNAMQQRSIMYYGNTNNDKLTRPYRKYFSADGSMEIKATFVTGNTISPTNVEFITYIDGDAYSASTLIKSDGTTQNYFYLHRDYQGSIMAITNASASVIEKRLYNAWGEIVKIQDGAGNNLAKLTFFDRGYTGHQHLESVGLIHMNARLYDPKLHRFLQPDNFVQDPYNTQNYNRYAYCINNPLKYTDISGNIFGVDDAILIGLGIGIAAYLTVNYINGTPITLKGVLMAAFVGAVSGAVTFGIGTCTLNIANFALKATAQALSHGLFQGTLSGIQGGGFWAGAASGALSSIASSAFAGGQNTRLNSAGVRENAGGGWGGAGKFAQSTGGMIAFGTVAGGAGAALTGGNFWQGAVTGLVVSGLNHAAHAMMQPKTTVAGIYGAGGEDASGNPNLEKLVKGKGGQMFSSSFGTNDDEIIDYLKAGFEKGNQLEIYAHSRGSAAAVRIANKLGAMHINISQITLYDPVGFYGGGSFNFDYPNVMNVTNYYQRNPVDGILWWANNPFQGSPVSGSFQWPSIRNVNYTGNSSINHINITDYAIKHP